MIGIKKYCKEVDIIKIEFIEQCCFKYLKGKWSRNDVQRLLARYSHYSFKEIEFIVGNGDKEQLYFIVRDIAEHMSKSIITKGLNLRPIRYHIHIDGMNRKERVIGVQDPLHQMYDYVAVEGMRELLDAKIGVFQCASLPGKGQAYGKKHIERWVRERDTVYFVKGDIKKCFPSIPHERLKELLKRDLKNDTLLWLVYELIDMFESGLSIGSYLSQYLSNYYLSYAYHYANGELFKTRKTKQKGNVRVRLINHVLFYMDDFLLTGSSKKDIKRAMRMLIKYINNLLELDVKPGWKVCKLSEAEPIDMMGFVFRKNRTIIRDKIFLKTRRYFLRAAKYLKRGQEIPLKLAYQCISAYGWYTNTNSYKVRKKLNMDEIMEECKQVVSKHAKDQKGGIVCSYHTKTNHITKESIFHYQMGMWMFFCTEMKKLNKMMRVTQFL